MRAELSNNIPVAYAVCYLIGTVIVAWFLSQVAPQIMGVDIAAACQDLERKLAVTRASEPGVVSAYRRFEVRAYQINAASPLLTKPLTELLPDVRLFVGRIRRRDRIIEARASEVLEPGDIIAVAGQRKHLIEKLEGELSLPEVEDPELLDVPAEVVDVLITSRAVDCSTLAELARSEIGRGVFLRRIMRSRMELPILPGTEVRRGDLVTLVGSKVDVETVVSRLGYPDRPTHATDMAFVGLGVLLGGLIGMPALALGSLKIGLGESVGVLLGGLIFGWLRSTRPTFGYIPEPALWLFESVGLAGFVAVVGLAAGPNFVHGLIRSGPSLIIAALFVALIPHLVGVLVGHRLLKMHPGILLGVCAGAGTATPALAAVQEVAKSQVPTLGYGVSYAIGNVLLALWGTIIVALTSP